MNIGLTQNYNFQLKIRVHPWLKSNEMKVVRFKIWICDLTFEI